jgi:uncharacterized DUF497 family protein
MEAVRYEWDKTKRVENLEKHGMDFLAVSELEWSEAIIVADERRAYGETRFRAYALLHGRLCAVVYTHRAGARRIISFRKANRREQAAYFARVAGRRG